MPIDNLDVDIQGLADLENVLLGLAPREARKALRAGMRKGAAVVKRTAESLVPVDTGLLQKAIKIKTRAGVDSGSVTENLGPLRVVFNTGKDDSKGFVTAKVGLYKPSKVAGRKKKYPGDPFYARWVEFGTSTTPAQPFLRPALERNRQSIVSDLAGNVKQAVEKMNRRKRG